MSLNLIIGRSNSGKSEYIMNEIMACAKKQAILFVPSSMRVIAEQEYLKYTNKKGIVDVNITSIDRFVDRNVNKNELFKTKEYLPDLAKKLLVRKVILENGDLFDIFAKVKNNVNFVDRLCSYMDSAKNQGLSSEDINNKYEEDDFLGKKIKEFVNIYKKVEDALNDRFVSSIDALEYYISELKSNNMFNGYSIFFDGYNNFSKVEFEYIKALLECNAEVTISLEIDLDKHLSGATEIFNTTYETLEYLRKICKEVGVRLNEVVLTGSKSNRPEDLAYLASNLFDLSKKTYDKDVSNVKLVLKENTYNEIEYIATDLSLKVSQGYRYNDFVIYTNDMESYITSIKKIFNTYNIPIYFNSSKDILSSSIVSYVILILKIITEGFKKDISPVISLMKTGLIKLDDIDEFENYVREFGIKGYMLEKAFTLNNKISSNYIYDLEKLNLQREQLVKIILDLKNKLTGCTTSKDITKVLYNHLESSGVLTEYEQMLKLVEKESINEYNRQVQTLSKLYEIMDNITLAYDTLDVKEYVELLEYGAREQVTDTIPEKIDQVYISDVNKNRGTEKKVGYIIGAYDGGLPTVQNEDNIFSDKELEKLKQKNIDLKQNRIDRNNMQLFNIYLAINKIRETLVITVPSSKMSGGSLRPSSLIQNIKNILNIKLETVPTITDVNMESNFMSLITRICELDDNADEQKIEELYNEFLLYTKYDKYRDILEYTRQDGRLSQEALDMIYKEKIPSSVSRLEQFKRCPFAYYSKYILNLKELKNHQVTTLDLGSLMHEVLEEISKFIIAKNIAWQDIVINEKCRDVCYKEIDNIVEKIFNESYSKYLVSPRYLVLKGKLKASMKKTIFVVADSFNHSEFRPLGYEIAFEDGALFAPIKIELENGKEIYLRGKIDRVDSANINGNTYLRIVDYKSSEKDLKLSDVKDGLSLQLMTYMWAMLENKEKISKTEAVIPAALSYFTISSKLLNITNYEKDKSKISTMLKKSLKLRGIYIKDLEVLEKLDNNVNNSNDSYLAVSSRSMNNTNKVLPEDVFVLECNNMKKILKKIADDMVKGNVSICPNKKVKEVCKYCKFNTMCRKEIRN